MSMSPNSLEVKILSRYYCGADSERTVGSSELTPDVSGLLVTRPRVRVLVAKDAAPPASS